MDLLVIVTLFFAVFTQSVTGFGSGLVSMAILPSVLGIRVAAPLVALATATLELALVIRYHATLSLGAVWRLSVGSLLGIPLGVVALRYIDEKVILRALGAVLVSYTVYALRTPALSKLKRAGWAYGMGMLGGVLSGAYNVGGPPLIIYGTSQRWPPAQFRTNLQALFLLNDALVITAHTFSRNITGAVCTKYLAALPAVALGVVAGVAFGKRINADVFRRVVLWLLLIMGLRLIIR